MELILSENQIQKLPVSTLSKRTLSILVQNDRAAKMEMIAFYSNGNRPNFNELLKVKDRLPELAKTVGMANMGKILMAEITKFVQCYTVVRPMSADQIAECAFALISTSEEDYLSLQDLVLFFDGAKQGKYGRILDHIDQHVIFEMLEVYREERHRQYMNIKDEKDTQFKAMGFNGRSSDDKDQAEQDIRTAVVDYYKTQFSK